MEKTITITLTAGPKGLAVHTNFEPAIGAACDLAQSIALDMLRQVPHSVPVHHSTGARPARGALYLSGPISHADPAQQAENIRLFEQAAALLRADGLDVVCPTENGLPADAPWAEHMRADIGLMMAHCTSVAALPRWGRSKGAQLEVVIAESLGWPLHDARTLHSGIADLCEAAE